MPKPKLLFLAQTLPYPPDGGVKIRTYHILRLLASEFDLTVLCFYRASLTANMDESVAALSQFGHVEAFPIPQEHSRRRLIADHALSAVTARSYTVRAYASSPFRKRLGHWLGTRRFDLIHADSLDLSGFFPMLPVAKVACTHHDVQSALLARRARQESNAIRRSYVAYQSRLMLAEERRWCPHVGLNVMVSEADRELLHAIAPQGSYTVVPNGVDVIQFTPDKPFEPGDGLTYVGGASWFPNLDAMRYFASEILPLVRKDVGDIPVRWIGRTSVDQQSEFGAAGVIVTGYVPDIRPLVKKSACFIVPIRVGGGTRIKILDAWAMGMPVVSTSVGCEGLDARHGVNILVADTPGEFAAAIQRVLERPELAAELGAAGRRTVERLYSWERIGHGLIESYHRLLEAPMTTGPRR